MSRDQIIIFNLICDTNLNLLDDEMLDSKTFFPQKNIHFMMHLKDKATEDALFTRVSKLQVN